MQSRNRAILDVNASYLRCLFRTNDMDLDTLRHQASTYLALRCPELKEGAAQLVDECLANAQLSFRNDFICRLSPQAWARITIIYFKHFIDTGCDVSIGEIFAAVIRDSINISRMDMLTLDLAQQKLDQAGEKKKPSLTIIKDE